MLEEMRKEMFGEDFYKDEQGIFVYEIWDNGFMFIKEVYVKPEFRKKGWVRKHISKALEKARENNCHSFLTTTPLDYIHADRSIKVMHNMGFKYSHVFENHIYFKKEI